MIVFLFLLKKKITYSIQFVTLCISWAAPQLICEKYDTYLQSTKLWWNMEIAKQLQT